METKDLIKVKIHSSVDVITNSSTVIYTYQNSVTQAKELVQEMLNLMGKHYTKPEDVFHYGVFCDVDTYLDRMDNQDVDADLFDPDDPTIHPTPLYEPLPTHDDWSIRHDLQKEWLKNIFLLVMTKKIEKPKWMLSAEESYDYSDWEPSTELYLIPKDKKYAEFGSKIQALLGSVDADGGHDG